MAVQIPTVLSLMLTSTRPVRCLSPVFPNQRLYIHLLRFLVGYHFLSLVCTSVASLQHRSLVRKRVMVIDDALKHALSYVGSGCSRSPDVGLGLHLSSDG